MTRALKPKVSLHTVILIHGIRTTALWQNEIRKTLESQSFKVQLTNYGRFDLLRFLCPGQFFRRRVLKDITQQVRDHRLTVRRPVLGHRAQLRHIHR